MFKYTSIQINWSICYPPVGRTYTRNSFPAVDTLASKKDDVVIFVK